jgi:hypothetical protein
MATVDDLLRRALLAVEAIGYKDTVEAQLKADGLELINNLISSWSGDGLMIPFVTEFNNVLTIGQSSYTIGSGGDFNTARPVRVAEGWIRDTSGTDFVLKQLARRDYTEIEQKSSSGRPERFWYYDQYPTGKIVFDNVPSKAETVYFNLWDYLTEFAATTDTVILPPEYKRAIIFNLGIDWSPEWGGAPAETIRIANESKKVIERLNVQPIPESNFDEALYRDRYGFNINAG